MSITQAQAFNRQQFLDADQLKIEGKTAEAYQLQKTAEVMNRCLVTQNTWIKSSTESIYIRYNTLLGGGKVDLLRLALDAKTMGEGPFAAQKVVFVSYQWSPASQKLAGDIQEIYEQSGIKVIRDIDYLDGGEWIASFMDLINHPGVDFVIPLVSLKYLRSDNCGYEINTMMNRFNWKNDVLPIRIVSEADNDANVFGDLKHHLSFWNQRKADLSSNASNASDLVKFETASALSGRLMAFFSLVKEKISEDDAQIAKQGHRSIIAKIKEKPLSTPNAPDMDPKYQVDFLEILQSFEQVDNHIKEKISGKDVILVLGNTGEGKSTLINYLAGCQMSLEKSDLGNVVVAKNPVAGIGHGKTSCTSYPTAHYDPKTNLSYCDCPGFSDNRGPIFDIPNAYAIKRITQEARSIKGVLVLVSYDSIKAARASSLRKTSEILAQLFGGNIQPHVSSIGMIITKMPPGKHISTDQLRQALKGVDGVIDQLISQMFVYDPLDRLNQDPKAITRKLLPVFLQAQKPILNSQEVFQFAIGKESEKLLREFVSSLENRLMRYFDAGKFADIRKNLIVLSKFNVIDYPVIEESIKDIKSALVAKIRELAKNEESLHILDKIKQELPYFSNEIEKSRSIILDHQNKFEAAKQARQEAVKSEKQAEQLRQQAEQARLQSEQAAERARQEAQRQVVQVQQRGGGGCVIS